MTCLNNDLFEYLDIWDGKCSLPLEEELIYPKDLNQLVIHRAGEDQYGFLHDTAIVEFNGLLLSAWYNCTEGEIKGHTLIRGKWSHDKGNTWSGVQVIAEDHYGQSVHYVPVSFISTKSNLYAFVTKMVGWDIPVSCDLFVLEEKEWKCKGSVAGPFISNCAAQKMADGNYIMGGRMTQIQGNLPQIPAVVISQGEEIIKEWEIVTLPGPWFSEIGIVYFPETSLIVDGIKITAFTRNDAGSSLIFESMNGGRTWEGPYYNPLPMVGSKIYSGKLSTGQKYLLYNAPSSKSSRELLVIALTGKSSEKYSKILKILDGFHLEMDCGPEWSYPCAIEHSGILYVTCTSEKRHCVLTKIPVASLWVQDE